MDKLKKKPKSKEELTVIAQKAVKSRRMNNPEWGKKEKEKDA